MLKQVLTIVNGFVHDFAAGCWAATLLAVWWLERSMPEEPAAAAVLSVLQWQFFWAGVACTFVVFATGAGRGFTYVENFYGADAEARRRTMLIVKHVVLFAVFGAGTWWQYGLVFG